MSEQIEELILVDENDNAIGKMEKMEVHQKGLLHRAFSVFIFNSKGELLLQQRADHKYHSAGLWTNTCCSHPHYGEKTKDAAMRRMQQEMGMNAAIEHAFSFTYRIEFANGLTEHEFDHVFIGQSDATPEINSEEVKAFRYVNVFSLLRELEEEPEKFTEWFRICFPDVLSNESVKRLTEKN